MKIAVTGGRDFNDEGLVAEVLGEYVTQDVTLAEGECRGADLLCKEFACKVGWPVVPFPANWKLYKLAAGPIRNQEILDVFNPDLLVVFPGGSGTMDMVTRATTKKTKIRFAKRRFSVR
jgi:hypothetical protein